MPDQVTLLRTSLVLGSFFGLPLLMVAYPHLRRSVRDRLFRGVLIASIALFIGGLGWAGMLVAPPGEPCVAILSEPEPATCQAAAPVRMRGWPLVDLGLAIPIAVGLTAIIWTEHRRRRRIDALLDELRR